MTISIQIYVLALGELAEDLTRQRWWAWLNAEEHARATRFVFPVNRIEFIAAHALTRWALANVVDATPDQFDFIADEKGKPSALLDGHAAPASFNLSHCSRGVGVAVSGQPGLQLGFDLEPLDRNVNLGTARTAFSTDEQAWLHQQPRNDQPRDFLRLWTLKESYIKAIGKGLSAPLERFSFDPDAIPISIHGVSGAWKFEQREMTCGHIAAVCWEDVIPCSTEWHLLEADNL